MSRVVPEDWFQLPSGLALAVGLPTVTLLQMMYWCPDSLPLNYMGPLGTLVNHLLTNYPVAVNRALNLYTIYHGLEGLYAIVCAYRLNLNAAATAKWALQSLIMGDWSTQLMRAKIYRDRYN